MPSPGSIVTVTLEATVSRAVSNSAPKTDATDLRFVTTNLDERHAALLRPGQAADIVLRFYPDTAIAGEVDVVLPRAAGAAGAAQARFVAHFRLVDTRGLALLPGMTGRAEITIEAE